MLSPRAIRAPRWAIGAVVVLASCTPGATSSGEDDEVPGGDDQPAATVTIPPSRLTPFCQAMIDLNDRLELDPPDDVEAEILETYEGIADEVPDEIRTDFEAVLDDLRSGGPASTDAAAAARTTVATPVSSDPLADEGRSPGDTPAERLSAYVDAECRSVENNPGPPATEPMSEPVASDP